MSAAELIRADAAARYPTVLVDRRTGTTSRTLPPAFARSLGLVYSCSGCGAVLFDRDTHHAWHERSGDPTNE